MNLDKLNELFPINDSTVNNNWNHKSTSTAPEGYSKTKDNVYSPSDKWAAEPISEKDSEICHPVQVMSGEQNTEVLNNPLTWEEIQNYVGCPVWTVPDNSKELPAWSLLVRTQNIFDAGSWDTKKTVVITSIISFDRVVDFYKYRFYKEPQPVDKR